MSLIVQKFGGSSVADKERVFNVAKRIIETYKKGNSVVVVVSAQGDTTDDLIEKAAEISKIRPNAKWICFFPQASRFRFLCLQWRYTSWVIRQFRSRAGRWGLPFDTSYSNARISKISADRIKKELEHKNIVVVAGFQGINKYEDITTLGRGGSDTSAVALAAALGADLCEIYTDVDGVYTADPRIVKNAKKMDVISFDEMLELASMGANVLHNRSVEMAKKYNVNLCVRSSLNNNEGTVVKEVNNMEKMLVKGVAHDLDVARISLCDIEDKPALRLRCSHCLRKTA